jgi:hypothetical protein
VVFERAFPALRERLNRLGARGVAVLSGVNAARPSLRGEAAFPTLDVFYGSAR